MSSSRSRAGATGQCPTCGAIVNGPCWRCEESPDCPRCGETPQWDGVLCGACGFFPDETENQEQAQPVAPIAEKEELAGNLAIAQGAKPPPLGPDPLRPETVPLSEPPDIEIIRVHCLGCYETLKAPANLIGQTSNCPNCNGEVEIRRIEKR